jgi:hypothetical protein
VEVIPFTTPRSNHLYHLAYGSDHLSWCFSPFLGRGLPTAKVSRQLSSYKVKMTAPQTPNWKVTVFLFFWHLAQNLSYMHVPTSSYAAAGIVVKLKEWFR